MTTNENLTEYEKARLQLFKLVYEMKKRHSKNERLYKVLGYVLLGVAVGMIVMYLVMWFQFGRMI